MRGVVWFFRVTRSGRGCPGTDLLSRALHWPCEGGVSVELGRVFTGPEWCCGSVKLKNSSSGVRFRARLMEVNGICPGCTQHEMEPGAAVEWPVSGIGPCMTWQMSFPPTHGGGGRRPGGAPGLQNQCGAQKVPGGFDSHTPPPQINYCDCGLNWFHG